MPSNRKSNNKAETSTNTQQEGHTRDSAPRQHREEARRFSLDLNIDEVSTLRAVKTIGEVAELAGVSIPTLRFYDKIGLLQPMARSGAGHRLYGRHELIRLREILIWRQLGFPLKDVQALIDDPEHDHGEALRGQLKLAGAQLDTFHALTRGLELAVKAVDEGRSIPDDDLFAGFAEGLADEDEATEPNPAPRRIATFALLSGRSHHGIADGLGPEQPGRIVATDPIEVGESLIALGILPVGAGTYEDRFSDGFSSDSGCWTWPPGIERSIREGVIDTGYRGGEVDRVARLEPDKIIDLTRYSWEGMAEIAPTVTVPSPPEHSGDDPDFAFFLRQVGDIVGRRNRAEELLSVWRARTMALRAHTQGRTVAVLATWGPSVDIWGGAYYTPSARHRCQVFSTLGIDVLYPGRASDWYSEAFVFDEDGIDELRADTLFVHTRFVTRDRADALLRSPRVSSLPASQSGRIYELGWEFVNSGWFGAHWQMYVVAHALGLTPLHAPGVHDDEGVYAVVDPAGWIALSTPFENADARLSGPGLGDFSVEIHSGGAIRVAIPPDAARDLCRLPERYTLSLPDLGLQSAFVHDRERARSRVASDASPLRAAGGVRDRMKAS